MLTLAGAGPMIAALLLVLIGLRDRIAACVGLAVLWFWAAYPYLQFHGRHVFHLEIVIIVVMLWAASLAVRTAVDIQAARAWRDVWKRGLPSVAIVATFFCLVV